MIKPKKNRLQVNKTVSYITAPNFENNKDFIMRDEVQDRYGNTIYLTDERWEHILENHPEMEGLRDKVLSAVRAGNRSQDPLKLDTFYYDRKFIDLHKDFDEIEVVVVFAWQLNTTNNFIVTAYPA